MILYLLPMSISIYKEMVASPGLSNVTIFKLGQFPAASPNVRGSKMQLNLVQLRVHLQHHSIPSFLFSLVKITG